MRFRDLPKETALWVKATIVSGAITSSLACGGAQQTSPPPTCGPCCHNPEGCQQMQVIEQRQEVERSQETVPPEDLDAGPQAVGNGGGTGGGDVVGDVPLDDRRHLTAPTCGPCCHGSGGPECGHGPSIR